MLRLLFHSNDTYHFFLNLFFASSWGIEKGLSFNGPAWSVSVEILLYAMFFAFCRTFNRSVPALISAVIFRYFVFKFNATVGSGVMFFFIGGLVFIAYEKLITARDTWKISIWLPWATTIAWLVAISATHPAYDLAFNEAPWLIHKIIKHTIYALFPMTIMSLALIETKRGSLGKRFSLIGDISYSSYLIHFPLILATVLITAEQAIDQELFYSPWFMALFFIVLIALSSASHRYFEVPMQRYLRRKN